MTIDPKNLSATATLTFGDEFNSLSLWNGTSGTWTTKYPFAPPKGGSLPSNGEQEWYINSTYAPTTSVRPWTVSNGVLTLTAQPASSSVQPLIDGYQYTSGMINTHESFSQQYGYFEMRAQLPAGQGLWPAFWLLQTDMSWPPEIDVMEVLGHDLTTLYTAAHTNQTGTHTSKGGTIKVANMSTGYHTYGVDWQKDFITYYFDGNQVFETPTPADMNEPMYMIANLAVGGYWPGMVNSTTPFPAQMKIDYIHAYADKGVAAPPPVVTPPPPSSGGGSTPPPTGGGSGGAVRGHGRDNTDDGSTPPDRPGRPDRTHDRDVTTRPDRTHDRDGAAQRDDTHDARNASDTTRETQRADTHGARNGSDTMRETQLANTHDAGDRSDTTRETQRADTHDSNPRHLEDWSAGSDTFTFDKQAIAEAGRSTDSHVGTHRLDHSAADQYLSFHSDSAGSTKVDFDHDAEGTAHQSPWMIAALDHVQPTGVHVQADWLVH